MFELKKKKESLEKIINVIENSLHEEGYVTKRYSETEKFGTTSYDCIIVRDETGKEYTLSVNERIFYSRELGRFEASNDLADEATKVMKYYEFNGNDFGYYALIGAMSEEDAINHYIGTVGDIEDENILPVEISKVKAREKLLNVCKDSDEESKLIKEFNKLANGDEPYLIVIDGSLL